MEDPKPITPETQQSEEEKRKEVSQKLLKDVIGDDIFSFAQGSKFFGSSVLSFIVKEVAELFVNTIKISESKIKDTLNNLPKSLEIEKIDEKTDKCLDGLVTDLLDKMKKAIDLTELSSFAALDSADVRRDLSQDISFLDEHFLKTDAAKKFLKKLIFEYARDGKFAEPLKIGKEPKNTICVIVSLMNVLGDFLGTKLILKKAGITQKDLLELVQKDPKYKDDFVSFYMSICNDLEKLKTSTRHIYNEKVEAKKDAEKFREKLGEVQAENKQLKDKLSEVKNNNDCLSKTNESLLAEKDRLLDEIEKLWKEKDVLENENKVLKGKVIESKEKVEFELSYARKCEREKAKVEKENEFLKFKLNKLMSEIEEQQPKSNENKSEMDSGLGSAPVVFFNNNNDNKINFGHGDKQNNLDESSKNK